MARVRLWKKLTSTFPHLVFPGLVLRGGIALDCRQKADAGNTVVPGQRDIGSAHSNAERVNNRET